jgi:hypothetical protein
MTERKSSTKRPTIAVLWRGGLLVLALWAATASPSIAGPPYVTDDPEPTDTGHWENYLFTEITHVAGQSASPHHS